MAQEASHAPAVHGGQNPVRRRPVLGAESAVGVGVFPYDLFAYYRPHTSSGPAPAGVIDPPEAGFVLKDYTQRAAFFIS